MHSFSTANTLASASPSVFIVLFAALLLSCAVSARSLNTISPITKDQVTPACYTAYTVEFSPECPPQPGICSPACITSLNEVGRNVALACSSAFVGMDSVMRRVTDGTIKEVVCNGAANPSKPPPPTPEHKSDQPQGHGKPPPLAPAPIKLPPSISADAAANYKSLLNNTGTHSNSDLVLDTRPKPTAEQASGQSQLVIEGSQGKTPPVPSATAFKGSKPYPVNSTEPSSSTETSLMPTATGAMPTAASPTESAQPPESSSGALRAYSFGIYCVSAIVSIIVLV